MVRVTGSVAFSVDAAPQEVKSVCENTLASYFAASSVRSVTSTARRLARRLQQSWTVNFEVFLYQQFESSAIAKVTELRTTPTIITDQLQREFESIGRDGFSPISLAFPDTAVDWVSLTAISTSTTSSSTSSSSSSRSSSTSTTSSVTRTSSTSTSQTSTTTPPERLLLLQSAEFIQGYSTLLLSFNEAVDSEGCDLFSPATLNMMGVSPRCTWLGYGRNLQVLLGENATITLGSLVETLPLSIRGLFLSSQPLNATVFSNEPLVQPTAVVRAVPTRVQACGRIVVSASSSTGAAGRAFQTVWSFGAGSTPQLAQLLQEKINGTAGTLLEIAAADFFVAVQEVKALMGEAFLSEDIQLEFVVNITNWLGLSDQASAVVHLDKSSEALPEIWATSATSSEVLNSAAVAFSVETRSADTSCSGAVAIPEIIQVSWSVFHGSYGSWTDLQYSGLTDRDQRPQAISFDPFSFEPGTYLFRANASTATSSVTQNFSLTVTAALPVIHISAPAQVSKDCGFSLDASESFDAYVAGGSDLDFEWSCSCSLAAVGSTMFVAGGQLEEGTYNFTVRATGRGGVAEATWQLDVFAGTFPAVLFSVPSQVSTQLTYPDVIATVQSGGCTVPAGWAWSFALLDESASSITMVSTNFSMDSNASEGLAFSTALSSELIPGRTYRYVLLQTDDQVQMDRLQFNLQFDPFLNTAAGGARVFQSQQLTADGPPSGGRVEIHPQVGAAMTTFFSGTTFEWYDEDVSSLSFAYYLLPLQQNFTVQNGGIVIEAFQPPQVDWTDSNSPFYWLALGGLFLTNVSDPSAAQWELQVLAPGNYITAVVARDRLGAISAAYTPGPVVELTLGVTVESATFYLEDALSHGDGDYILHALSSVSSLDLVSNSSDELASMTDLALQALRSAANILEPTATSLDTFGEVASSIGRDGTPEVAEQISGTLEVVLDATLASTGVSIDTGTSLLRAIVVVQESFARENVTSMVSLHSQTLRSLAVKLGESLLLQTPVNATSQLSVVNELGTEITVFNIPPGAGTDALTAGNVQISGFSLGRRLSGCGSSSVQLLNFVSSNPFRYLSSGISGFISPNASVTGLEVKRCDLLVSELNSPITVSLPLNGAQGSPPEGYFFQPACVWLDESAEVWTSAPMTWIPPSANATSMDCVTSRASGFFSAIYVPVLLPLTTRTTTTLSTSVTNSTEQQSTSTTAETSTPAKLTLNEPLTAQAGVVTAVAVLASCCILTLCCCLCKRTAVVSPYEAKDAQDGKESGKEQAPPAPPAPQAPPAPMPVQSVQRGDVEQKDARKDAQEHFWNWANDIASSRPTPPKTPDERVPWGRSKTEPDFPAPASFTKISDTEEYFDNFADELRQSVGFVLPGSVESPSSNIPPPPPKRAPRPALPPPPPPIEGKAPAPPMVDFVPPMVNAHRVQVRVDEAFLDWASDFPLQQTAREQSPPPPPLPAWPAGRGTFLWPNPELNSRRVVKAPPPPIAAKGSPPPDPAWKAPFIPKAPGLPGVPGQPLALPERPLQLPRPPPRGVPKAADNDLRPGGNVTPRDL